MPGGQHRIEDIEKVFEKIIDDEADIVIGSRFLDENKKMPKYEKKVRDASKSLRDEEEIYRIRRMTENIRRVSEYASDIAEIVLNMNIEKTMKKSE